MAIEIIDPKGNLKITDPGQWTIVSNSNTGTQNNWDVGISGSQRRILVEWNGASDITVTGIKPSGSAGDSIVIKNISSNNMFFSTDDAGSGADARLINFLPNGKLTPVAPLGSIEFYQNGTNWKIVNHNQGPSLTYAVSWTATAGAAPAVGNGTLVGSYNVRQRLVQVFIQLTAGSTTTFGNAGLWKFSVPLALQSGFNNPGVALGQDTGVTNYPAQTSFFDANNVLILLDTTGAFFAFNAPFAWGNTDVVILGFEYQA